MARVRLVALFDLPANTFAETGVNTTLIVAYKPAQRALGRLNESGYSVFVRDIQAVGYEKRTKKRNTVFNPIYRVSRRDFHFETDAEGRPVPDEDFTATLREFRDWALGQEEQLQTLFVRED